MVKKEIEIYKRRVFDRQTYDLDEWYTSKLAVESRKKELRKRGYSVRTIDEIYISAQTGRKRTRRIIYKRKKKR